MVDLVRQIVDGEQLALIAHLHRDRLGAQAVEDLLNHDVRQLDPAVSRIERLGFGSCRQHHRYGARDRQAVREPVQAEVRDGWHIDQHFGDHHEQNRE